tara:strand:+ start:91 stop:402 length:312 start_codon:yes stop_codon:yes gene_type:complete
MARKLKSLTLIEDAAMEPYFITKDENCYTVNQRIQSNADHFRSKGKSKEYTKALTFHANFGQALNRITQDKLHTKEHYTTLDSFLNEFRTIENNIKNYINEKA